MTVLADVARELREWHRVHRRPGRVAAFAHPGENLAQWLTTLPVWQLRVAVWSLESMRRWGRLRGENIRRLRAIRVELARRLENADRPNRSPMDVLSPKHQRWIVQYLNPERTLQ